MKAEKLTDKKLVDLPPSLKARLNKVAASRSEPANEIIRRGLVAELDRLEQQASVETQRMDMLRKLAAAEGTDVDALLQQLVNRKTSPALPGMADLASDKLPGVETANAA